SPVGDPRPPTSRVLYTSCNVGNWNPSPAFLLRHSNLKRRVLIPLHLVLSSFFSPKKACRTLSYVLANRGPFAALSDCRIVCPDENFNKKWAHRYGCRFLRGRHSGRWSHCGIDRERSRRYRR